MQNKKVISSREIGMWIRFRGALPKPHWASFIPHETVEKTDEIKKWRKKKAEFMQSGSNVILAK